MTHLPRSSSRRFATPAWIACHGSSSRARRLAIVMTAPARAEAPRRVAPMIGNETYKSLAPLGNPRLDAGRLAALLDANSFDVVGPYASPPGLPESGLPDGSGGVALIAPRFCRRN
jgi:hypothetical protein